MENTPPSAMLTLSNRPLEGDAQVLTAVGEVDIYSTPQLADAFEQAAQGGTRRVLLDLSGVEYIDSTGLSTLIKGNNRFQEVGGELVLVAPRPRIARLLDLTGLNERLTVAPSLEEALRLNQAQ